VCFVCVLCACVLARARACCACMKPDTEKQSSDRDGEFVFLNWIPKLEPNAPKASVQSVWNMALQIICKMGQMLLCLKVETEFTGRAIMFLQHV
jgi:hypothetical protein